SPDPRPDDPCRASSLRPGGAGPARQPARRRGPGPAADGAMSLWPPAPGATPALDLPAISREVEAFARGSLPPWEVGYLDYHRRRYADTLRLLPDGHGRRLLDVGSFPGHLSALARARGWEVT